MPELHSPSGESFPPTCLLFPWSLISLKVLEPRPHPMWARAGSIRNGSCDSPQTYSLSTEFWEMSFLGLDF